MARISTDGVSASPTQPMRDLMTVILRVMHRTSEAAWASVA
jgi:hypothetical protein